MNSLNSFFAVALSAGVSLLAFLPVQAAEASGAPVRPVISGTLPPPAPAASPREVPGGTHRLPRQKLDSLQLRLRQHPQPDTVRVNRLNALALALRTNNPATSAALFREALALSTRLQYLLGRGHARFGLGYHYRDKSQYDSALTYTQRAYHDYTQLRNDYHRARALYGMARIYFEQGLYGQSMASCLEGLQLARAQRSLRPELFLLTQLGHTSTALGEYEQAHQYLRQAQRLAQQLHDPIGSGHAYTALGELSQQQERWARAQQFYEQAIASYQAVYNAQGLLPSRIRLLDMAERQGRAQQALAEGAALLRQATTASEISRLHVVLARAWLQAGQPDSAARHGRQSLRVSQASRLKEVSASAAQLLAQVAARQNRFAEAYRYQQLTSSYADSLTGNATRRLVAALQFRASREREQSQRRELAQQQQVARLRQQRQTILWGALTLVAAVASGLGVWQYRRQQAARDKELRTRLAADLNNDVGALLQQISEQSGLLQEGLADGEAQRRQLDQISESSRSAMRQLNDVVWSLDSKNDKLADLLDRLREYAHEVLDPAGLSVTFAFPTTQLAQPLSSLLRRNLYLIYKESLRNLLDHASCATAVAVSVQLMPGSPTQLALEVRDNCGTQCQPQGRQAGRGLRTISARAQSLGGISYSGSTADGFRVYVVAPLAGGWNAPKRYQPS
ncbi:tetratricopeptide repeat-containing sensor histidine kinase [Hymenobacter fodinae]|uniref:Tetratricopeptide repeat protein n=1 Tax=Hymenobacter fodinae TaxID=2510796 RepID=A0A4Z0P5U0_9BACT|nr:tetratricopeptide repeat protein [Hymenobacter fodinae]TGE06651.1 tetratricopeptide repeat protein [Hymenobacter fodinae]